MNLHKLKQLLKSRHPSNSLRVAPGNTVEVSRDRLKTRIVVDGRNNRVTMHASVRLRNMGIEIHGSDNVLTIGENCLVLGGKLELFGDGNQIDIGAGSVINEASIIAHWGTRVRIGAGCLFSSAIDVRTTDSHSILDASGARINKDMNVHIGDRVWLGRGVSVTKGAEIGDDVVVATMAVVARSIPPNCVAAGIPAKVIKTGTTWSTERL